MRPVQFPFTSLAQAFLLMVLLSPQAIASLELGRSQSGSLEVVLTDKSLQVWGATPLGDVAYLGANREEVRESWGSLRTYSGVLTDEDGNGQVEFAPETGIAQASVWVVIDLASGEVVGINPDSFGGRLPDEADLEVLSGGSVVAADRQDLEFLLYRPGVGVWFGKGLDGGAGDDNLHADGRLRVGLGAFRSLWRGGPAAPASVRSRDRLLAVDLVHLDSIDVRFE